MTEPLCPICGSEVKQPDRRQGGGTARIFCSEDCRGKNKRSKPGQKAYQRVWVNKKNAKLRREGRSRDISLKMRYGISEAEWEALFDSQGRCCAICGTPKPRSKVGWHTDHDHDTRKVRGILCEHCNRGLGMYQDDISLLRRAAVYLGQHMGVVGAAGLKRSGVLSPFVDRAIFNGLSYGASNAGYDIRIDQDLVLRGGEFKLASAVEYFEMPHDLVAIVHDKSTWARKGLQVFNTVVEPGWRGYLTLELVNHSTQYLRFTRGDPIAQVVFHSLDVPTDRPYSGKYQDQPRRPVGAIDEPESIPS